MNARQYQEHWATLTGRPAKDVYVPRALREPAPAGPFPAEFLADITVEDVQAMLDRINGTEPRS